MILTVTHLNTIGTAESTDTVVLTVYGGAGPTGADGAAGSAWLNGSGVPGAGIGVDGDYYLNNDNADVYNKVAGAWVLVSNISGGGGSFVTTTTLVTAGAGLTGGGDLSTDRTLNVAANADASIVVNANDIQIGVLATDAQHGVRGGGTQHANAVAAGAAGFMTGSDKSKLDALPSSAPPTTLTITAGTGLTGGGDLSANRTINAVANADGSIIVNADDLQVGVLATDAQHGARGNGTQHTVATGAAAGFMAAADKTKLDGLPSSAVPTTRTVTAGAGLTGGGDLSADIAINAIANADGSIVVAANDIGVGILASDAQHGARGGTNAQHPDAVAAGASGFMTGADKTKLDGVATGATKQVTGTATVDFGAFPGNSDVTLAIASATIAGGSVVRAWIHPVATADHSIDEHCVEEIAVFARDVSAGVGFSVFAASTGSGLLFGQYTIGWSWQ